MKPRESAGQLEDDVQKQWQVTVDLLRTIHHDYRQARRQIEEVCSLFSGRESAVGHRLKNVLELTGAAERKEPEPYLQVNCLGNFEVFLGYHRVEQWGSLKAKAVFKYLVAQRRHLASRDTLMEALWQGCPPEMSNSNLKAAVYSLRKTLGALSPETDGFTYIQFIDGHYLINPEITVLIDDEEFERHYVHGQRLEREGDHAGAMAEYMTAERLYAGDYLEEDLYEDWTLLRREALKDIYLGILIKLAEYSSRAADYENCIGYCQKILAKDPCCEEGYRHLMRSYSRLGQRNRAIQWYRVCEKTITTELEVKPEHLTVSLYNRLLKDEAV